MKNLFVFWDEPLSETGGGIHRCIKCLIEHLPVRGYNVFYFYSKDFYQTFTLQYPKDNKTTLNKYELRQFILDKNCDVILGQEAIFSSTFTKAVYSLNLPDVKLVNQYHTTLLYFRKKLNFDFLKYIWYANPTIKNRLGVVMRAIAYPLWRLRVKIKQNAIYRYNYNFSDVSLLLSEYEIPIMSEIIGGKAQAKCVTIHNPLSWCEIANPRILKEKKKEVLMVSRIYNIEKRIDLALKVWEKLEKSGQAEDWTLRIVGEGVDKEMLEEMTRRLNLQNVRWEGRQDPLPYYQRASIFLLTSIAEGWALTLTESMQNGVVPLAFDSYPAVRSIITDGYDGYLVPTKDIDMMAERLATLMHDCKKREQMALNGLESCRRFTIDKVMDQWKVMLDNLLSDRH